MLPSYRNQSANQLTGFYMMATLVVKTLITIDRRGGQLTPHVMRSRTSVFFKKWRLKLQFRNFQTSNFYFVLWFAAKYMMSFIYSHKSQKLHICHNKGKFVVSFTEKRKAKKYLSILAAYFLQAE